MPAVKRSGGLITVNGRPALYSAEGQGTPCLLVGFGAYWSSLMSDNLKRHAQLISVEYNSTFVNHHEQDFSEVTMSTLLDEIEETRSQLGHDELCLIGFSALGYLALEYSLRHPERVSHVVLIGTPPKKEQEYDRACEELWKTDASDTRKQIALDNQRRYQPMLDQLPLREQIAIQYVADGPYYWHDPTVNASWLWTGFDFNPSFFAHFYYVILDDYDITGRFSEITAPVFITHGRHDYVAPYTMWDKERPKLPNATFHLFLKSGHYPFFEEPELFDQRLINWLSTARRRPSGEPVPEG